MRARLSRAATMRPTPPVAAPASTTTSPSRASAEAASSTASVPARWPLAGWRRLTFPPRSRSAVVSSMPQLGPETRLADEAAGLSGMVVGHQNPTRESADHALEGADMRIRHENRDIGVLQ